MKGWSRFHTQQVDETDCGAACISTILKFNGVQASLEEIKEKSGASKEGTTLLGLKDAITSYGLNAEGYSASIADLKELKSTAILHTESPDGQHYIVLISFDRDKFMVSDPSKAKITALTEDEMIKLWVSRRLLLVTGAIEPANGKKNGFIHEYESILKIIRGNSNLLGVILTIGIVSSFLELSTAIFTQQLVDKLIPKNNFEQLITALLAWFTMLAALSLFSLLRSYLLAKQSLVLNRKIMDHFLGKLLFMPKRFFDSKKTGDMIARLNDSQKIEDVVRKLFSVTIIDGIFILVGMLFLYSYHSQLILIVVISIPAYIIISLLFTLKIQNSQRAVMANYASVESRFIDSIYSVEEIKSSRKENVFQKRMFDKYSSFQKSLFHLEKLSANFKVLLEFVSILTISAMVANCLFYFLREELTIGALIAVIPVTSLIIEAITSLTLINLDYQGAKLAFRRVEEYSNANDLPQSSLRLSNITMINISQLSFRFPGKLNLLENVNMSLEKGKWYGLLGESGSGKSTFLQILQKFYAYKEGSILINSAELSDISVDSWREKIASVPQSTRLHFGGVIENIAMDDYSEEVHNQVISFCSSLGFDKFFDQFPNGYDTVIGDGGVNISGGQQQLVSMARALYQKPELLLLDEATSAMDREMEGFVLDMIKTHMSQLIVVVVTHRVKPVAYSDYIYILSGNTISDHGTYNELVRKDNLLSSMINDINA